MRQLFALFPVLVLIAAIVASPVHAQEGKYTGLETPGGALLVLTLKIAKEPNILGAKRVTGTYVATTEASGKVKLKANFKGALADGQILGKFTALVKGKKREEAAIGFYDAATNSFTFNLSRVFKGASSEFRLSGKPNPDISGVYNFSAAGPVRIKYVNLKTFRGTYRGLASQGHGRLRGVLEGDVNDGVWTGRITIDEDAVHVEGGFTLTYNATAPATLTGIILLDGRAPEAVNLVRTQ